MKRDTETAPGGNRAHSGKSSGRDSLSSPSAARKARGDRTRRGFSGFSFSFSFGLSDVPSRCSRIPSGNTFPRISS